MDVILEKHERENKRKGFLVSAVIHTLLLALILLPLLTFPDPPPGQEGVLVNLGADFGQGEEDAPEQQASVTEPSEDIPETPPTEEQPEETDPVEEPVTQPEDTPEEQTPEREVVETEDPDAVALRRAEEAAERARREAEAEAERQRQAEAAAEAAAQAERERQEQETRDRYSNVFGDEDSDGPGEGTTGQTGNQGDPNGDPDSSILEGQSVGAGDLGGGLVGRGVSYKHQVDNPTNSFGKVVVKVCVDANGRVISAESTLAGTTATDPKLKDIAVAGAKRWTFSASSTSRQCGTITYTFKPRGN